MVPTLLKCIGEQIWKALPNIWYTSRANTGV